MAVSRWEFDLAISGTPTMKRARWFIIGFIFLLISGAPQPVNASSETFMIRPELPANNRVGQQAGYFDLKLGHSRRRIAVRVYNPQHAKLKLRIRLLQATTQENGKLQYQRANADLSKQFAFSSSQTIAPRTQTQVLMTLPNRATIGTGTKLMAIELTTINASTNATVNNRVRYRIGLVLQGQARSVSHQFKLVTVGKRVALQKPILYFGLAVQDGRFRSAMTVRTNLQHANQPWLNYQVTQPHLRWAPDTTLPLTVKLAGKQLHAGIYRVTMQATLGQKHQTITRYLAIAHNGNIKWATKQRYDMAQRWWWGLVIGLLILLLAVIVLFRQRRKRHAQIDR